MGLDVIKPDQLESTARGVAWMAGLTMGMYKDLETILRIDIPSKTYHSLMSNDLRERLLEGWQEAVKATIQYKRPSLDDLK